MLLLIKFLYPFLKRGSHISKISSIIIFTNCIQIKLKGRLFNCAYQQEVDQLFLSRSAYRAEALPTVEYVYARMVRMYSWTTEKKNMIQDLTQESTQSTRLCCESSNACLPVIISNSSTPKENTSVFSSTMPCIKYSGAK